MNSKFFIFHTLLLGSLAASLKITINSSVVVGTLPKFWKSTGFSPTYFEPTHTKQFLISKDVELNLAIISSLPQQGIEFVRIHWLLNLLYFSHNSTNWELLDRVIDWIVGNEMKPIFELMINPETIQQKIFFKNGGRKFWKDFTSSIVRRYVDKYGSKLVSKWRFESWNEPDLQMYNTLNFRLKEYIDYMNGSTEGIKSILPDVEFGGPAGLFKNITDHPLCWGFLDYCNKLPNKCNLSYISLHKKGNRSSSDILNDMKTFHIHLKEQYPNLATLPLVNDETDLLSGWWRDEEWRGDVRYAAAVCRTIYLYKLSLNSLNIKRISNDNGFLNNPPSFFNQRTLLTRFFNKEKNALFVQKPVYAAMGLLALLGEQEVQTFHEADERLSLFSTRVNHETKNSIMCLNVMIVHSSDKMEINNTETELEILAYLPDWKDAHYALYKLENNLPNPKQLWQDFGCPKNPSKSQLSAMRKFQEPHKVSFGFLSENPFKIRYNITQPSISFLQICSSGVEKPGKVRKLKAYNISNDELLLTWKESNKHLSCIKTYIVEYCPDLAIPHCFRRINENTLIFNSFHVSISGINQKIVSGFYRVAAVDFWKRKGRYSNVLKFMI